MWIIVKSFTTHPLKIFELPFINLPRFPFLRYERKKMHTSRLLFSACENGHQFYFRSLLVLLFSAPLPWLGYIEKFIFPDKKRRENSKSGIRGREFFISGYLPSKQGHNWTHVFPRRIFQPVPLSPATRSRLQKCIQIRIHVEKLKFFGTYMWSEPRKGT